MKIDHIFDAPTTEQTAVFAAVAPIIERVFPAASAYTDCWDNKITFDCGFVEEIAPNKEAFYEPDEAQLIKLCSYLNSLAAKQNSKIKFKIVCYDYGGPIPSAIVASW